jgi:fumarylacetoacetase
VTGPAHIDATHDASLRSWVMAANDPGTDFPIQNLPFGLFRPRGSTEPGGPCVAIGDRILSLPACAREKLVSGEALELTKLRLGNSLNALMAEGREAAGVMRRWLVELLQEGNTAAERRGSRITIPLSEVELRLPAKIGDYSDFYASIHHATNIGSMFRPDSPLMPNYKYIPIGYHGRASSIVVSPSPVRRPHGQTRDDANGPPVFGPTRRLDYEVEVGAFIGRGNPLGQPIQISQAEKHLWGLCLLNDWSARDIQSWEYQPLGPFLSKSFMSTVSPWIVTLDALAPFRAPGSPRPPDDPAPLPYLSHADDQRAGGFDLVLEVSLQSARMREKGTGAMLVSRSRFRDMYWTLAQLATHHASNGCNLRPGDLIGSGTVSGPDKESRGCLLERASRGAEPLELPTGERRAFLEDGDEVILRGYAEREGFRRIGFGECSGVVSA